MCETTGKNKRQLPSKPLQALRPPAPIQDSRQPCYLPKVVPMTVVGPDTALLAEPLRCDRAFLGGQKIRRMPETLTTTTSQKASKYTSNLYCNTPPICTAVLSVPPRSQEREILSAPLPFVSQYASRLYCNTPPICIAVLLGKSWWLWSPECSPEEGIAEMVCGTLKT